MTTQLDQLRKQLEGIGNKKIGDITENEFAKYKESVQQIIELIRNNIKEPS